MQPATRQTYLLSVVAATLVLAIAGTALAQPGSSNLGTWKLNVAKSTFAPGTAPKSSTFTNVVAGEGIKTPSDTVRADGTVIHSEYTEIYNGKDTPITGTSLNGDTVAGTRVDANTITFVYKKNGKVTVTSTNVAAADRKTYTITSKGTNTLGQTINSVAVYDKQ